MIEIKESNFKKYENEIEKLESINLDLNTKVKTLEEQARKTDNVNERSERDDSNVNNGEDVTKLQEENVSLKQNLESLKGDYSRLKDALAEERIVLEKDIEDLKAENIRIKESANNESGCDHDSINKYREFLKRAQDEYKFLENDRKKD